MTLRHIKIFVAICEHGNSVTKAADALFLSQPAVSLALKELEQYYGVILFERLSRQLLITEAGKHMREYAAHILSLFDEMEKGLRNWDSIGRLRVGASITIGSQFMPGYVSAYRALHPGIDVRVCVAPSERLEGKLLSNELDFALIEGTVHDPNLIRDEYMDDALLTVCSADGPFRQGETVPLERFSRQNLLLREKGSGTREEFDSAALAVGLTVQPVWEATSTTALVNAVVHNLGVAVLPERMVLDALKSGRIVSFTVEGLALERKFSVIYHRNKFLTPSARAFIKLCKGGIPPYQTNLA